jgi:hypothetical protein
MAGPNLLGSRYSDASKVLRVDADLKGLPEPLVDADRAHVAQAHQQLACARSVVCTGALQVRVA